MKKNVVTVVNAFDGLDGMKLLMGTVPDPGGGGLRNALQVSRIFGPSHTNYWIRYWRDRKTIFSMRESLLVHQKVLIK